MRKIILIMGVSLLAANAFAAGKTAAEVGADKKPAEKLSAAWEFSEVLGQQPDLAHGAVTFETCSACHGKDGGGLTDGTVPRLAGQHYRVLVKQLVDFRNARRWDYRMEHFADRHHLPLPQDVADVAAYAAQLTPTSRSAIGAGGEGLGRGARVYIQRCQSCHGALGQGDGGKLVPRLAGQQYAYLLRQLHDAAEGRRPTLAVSHGRLVRAFDKAQLEGVADYLSRSLDAPATPRPAQP